MISAVLLLLLGLFLIFLEFFLPGGIMGTAGALALVGSVVVFALDASSPLLVLGYVILVAAALTLLIKFALWRVRSGKAGRSVYLHTDQEGYKTFTFDEEAVGKEGVAQSDLKPSGFVKVQGKRHQAVAKTGYINKGSPITVTEGRGAYLVVKLSNKGPDS